MITYEHLTDEQIIYMIKDSPIYENLYGIIISRYSGRLRGFIYKNFVRDLDAVEDVLQETFINAYFGLKTFDCERKLQAWIYKIAVNVALNHINKPKTVDLDSYLWAYSGPESLEEEFLQTETLKKFDEIIDGLDQRSQKIADLYFRQDYNCEEISHIVGMRLSVVKYCLERVRKLILINSDL
jgi:RNA polymerase sigma factor (sigma-70 family)